MKSGDASQERLRKKWWLGRIGWGCLLLAELVIYANCSTIAWVTHGLSWIAWVVASISLPMLVMRRVLPPSILAANSKVLLATALTLTLAGWLVFTKFTDFLGTTVFVTLGAFSLGFAIWLTMLGMQGVGAAATRVAISTPLDGRVLAEAMRRGPVLLSLIMVMLVTAAVVQAASVLPLLSEVVMDSSTGRDAVAAMVFFWIGGGLGACSRFARWEGDKVRAMLLVGVLLAAVAMVAALSHWPLFLIGIPTLILGYAWARSLREAGEILRAGLQRSLRRRVSVWLLTWMGAGAMLAGLLAFSLMRDIEPGTWNAWLRGALPAVVMLIAASVLAWWLRTAPRDSARKSSGVRRWFDFPGMDLAPYGKPPADATVIEIAYDVPEQNLADFIEAMAGMEAVRLEEGAAWWTLSRDASHPTVYHEFFRVESWAEYQLALKDESEPARLLKQRAFAANDWETLPAEIHYPVLNDYSVVEVDSGVLLKTPAVGEISPPVEPLEISEPDCDDNPECEFLEDLADADTEGDHDASREKRSGT